MKEQENYIEYLRKLSKEELEHEIEGKIADSHHELEHAAAVSSEIAMTNAAGFYVDDYNVTNSDLSGDPARVSLNFHMSGDQDKDKPWSGTEINGQAIATIDAKGGVSYTDVSAERNLGGDDGDDT
jgi:hypothetical protein